MDFDLDEVVHEEHACGVSEKDEEVASVLEVGLGFDFFDVPENSVSVLKIVFVDEPAGFIVVVVVRGFGLIKHL